MIYWRPVGGTESRNLWQSFCIDMKWDGTKRDEWNWRVHCKAIRFVSALRPPCGYSDAHNRWRAWHCQQRRDGGQPLTSRAGPSLFYWQLMPAREGLIEQQMNGYAINVLCSCHDEDPRWEVLSLVGGSMYAIWWLKKLMKITHWGAKLRNGNIYESVIPLVSLEIPLTMLYSDLSMNGGMFHWEESS